MTREEVSLSSFFLVSVYHMGDCQNYGPFLGPYYNTGPNLGDPKRDHNFDNPPYTVYGILGGIVECIFGDHKLFSYHAVLNLKHCSIL